MGKLRIGTCSWNYPSWVGLVYSRPSRSAAGYLREYAWRFRTAEVDSFFYRLPDPRDVAAYLAEVDEGFGFSVKVTEDICLTHRRNRGSKELIPNPGFLSPDLFADYVGRLGPMRACLDAVMLEFEYLNKSKMPGLEAFLRALDDFLAALPADLRDSLPLAIETRNANYLRREYFEFLRERRLIHVFSEKQYMPSILGVHEEFGDLIAGDSVIRLLGGDRAEIEAATGEDWSRIVAPKADKERLVDMTRNLLFKGGRVIININNHYEGSAPRTAEFFERAFGMENGVMAADGEGGRNDGRQPPLFPAS